MGTKKEKKEVAAKPVVETKPKAAPKRVVNKPAAKAPAKPATKPVAKPATKPVAKPLAKPATKTVRKVPPKSAPVAKPEHEHIQVRAYHIALERRASGHEADPIADWLEAERQIRS